MNISDIDSKGYIIIKNFFSANEIQTINKELSSFFDKHGHKKIALTDSQVDEFTFGNLNSNLKFKEIIKEFFDYENEKNYENDLFRVLRVLSGKTSGTDNQNYHFDGYHLTAMFPLIMPSDNDNKNGDFMLVPNIRKVFGSKLMNNFVKFIFQNKLTKLFYKTNFFNYIFRPIKIIPEVNSLILFRGFTSLHGSGILGSNKTRVTLLYHYKKLK